VKKSVARAHRTRRIILLIGAGAIVVCLFLFPLPWSVQFSLPQRITQAPTLPGITDVKQLTQVSVLLANPSATPLYLTRLQPNPGYVGPFAATVCFSVWDGPPLTSDLNAEDYVWKHTTFIFDGKKIDGLPFDQENWLLLEQIEDGAGHLITVGGPLETCYDLHPGIGLHQATVQIKSMAGVTYEYTWAFSIQTTDPTRYSVVMTATLDTLSTVWSITETAFANTQATCTAANLCPTFPFRKSFTPSPEAHMTVTIAPRRP